jgi:hypothetical protein
MKLDFRQVKLHTTNQHNLVGGDLLKHKDEQVCIILVLWTVFDDLW